MNRFKIFKKDYVKAKEYLTGKGLKKNAPSWAKKFKDDLEFKKNKLHYKGLLVIPQEDIESYLRNAVYDKNQTYHFHETEHFI